MITAFYLFPMLLNYIIHIFPTVVYLINPTFLSLTYKNLNIQGIENRLSKLII